MRGFTALSERLPPQELVDLLNRYFDCQVPPILEHGGEVLKFIGDGLLAIFPLAAERRRRGAGLPPRAAAAREARALIEALDKPSGDSEGASASASRCMSARCMYGNIGGGNRLDFTCIGPAVNLAARMEKVAAQLGQSIVASAEFAAHLPQEFTPARRVAPWRAFAAPQAVFGLDRLKRNDGASPIMSDDDYHPFIPNPPERQDRRTDGARACRDADQANPRAKELFAQLGADAQRAVPRHHHRRRRHPRSLRAAAGGRADAGDDRGRQRAAGRDVAGTDGSRRAFRSARTIGGAGRTPSSMSSTTGLRLDEISEPLRDAVLAVLRVSMSQHGYELSRDVMKLNRFLGDIVHGPAVMGEWSYIFCLFGEPSTTEPWGWQLFGHHLVLNCFVLGQQMVLTPAFWGAEPNYADHGPFKGIRLFQDEERAGLKLMRAFTPEQQKRAIVAHSMMGGDLPEGRRHFADNLHLGGAFQDNRVVPYEGLKGDALNATQRRDLMDLVGKYLAVLPEGPRKARIAEVERHLPDTHFCWIGGFSRGRARSITGCRAR